MTQKPRLYFLSATLSPRQPLSSVPYALVAEDLVVDPTTNIGTVISNIEMAISNAQDGADAAQAAADGAASGHTVDTTLDEAAVVAFVASNNFSTGAHTVDTNTQLTSAEVASAATAEGFVTGPHTTDTNTQLNEAQVDGFVANNGYASQAQVSSLLNSFNDLQNKFSRRLHCSLEPIAICTDGPIPTINLGEGFTGPACRNACELEMPGAGMTSGCWLRSRFSFCFCRTGATGGVDPGDGRSGGTCN